MGGMPAASDDRISARPSGLRQYALDDYALSIRMPIAIATSRPPATSVPSPTQLGIESTGPQAIRAPRTTRASPPRSAPIGACLASGDAVMVQTVAD